MSWCEGRGREGEGGWGSRLDAGEQQLRLAAAAAYPGWHGGVCVCVGVFVVGGGWSSGFELQLEFSRVRESHFGWLANEVSVELEARVRV